MTGAGSDHALKGFPEVARRRLAALRDRPGRWTSGLDTMGLLALRRVGMQPVGQVAGAATYTERAISGGYGLREQVAEAMREGRRRALDRLALEALQLGAHGIVEVQLASRPLGDPDLGGVVVHEASGTAVDVRGADRLDRPFVAGLGARDVALLVGSGFMPCDLALGCAAWLVGSPVATTGAPQPVRVNAPWEVVNWSRALAAVRIAAMRNLRREAEAAGGTEVVGVRLETRTSHIAGDFSIGVVVLGTTVLSFGSRSTPSVEWLLSVGCA